MHLAGSWLHHGHRTIDEQYGKLDDVNEKASSGFLKNCNIYAVHLADSTNEQKL